MNFKKISCTSSLSIKPIPNEKNSFNTYPYHPKLQRKF